MQFSLNIRMNTGLQDKLGFPVQGFCFHTVENTKTCTNAFFMLSLLSWTQATKSQLTSNNFNANRNIHRDQQSVSARQWFSVENTVNLQHEFCITPNFSIIIFMYKCHLMLITLKVFHCICPAGGGERRGGDKLMCSQISNDVVFDSHPYQEISL